MVWGQNLSQNGTKSYFIASASKEPGRKLSWYMKWKSCPSSPSVSDCLFVTFLHHCHHFLHAHWIFSLQWQRLAKAKTLKQKIDALKNPSLYMVHCVLCDGGIWVLCASSVWFVEGCLLYILACLSVIAVVDPGGGGFWELEPPFVRKFC